MSGERVSEAARAPLDLGREAELAPTADGLVAAAHYGDPEAEYRQVVSGCGLVDRLWVEHLDLGGADRARFLNGMVTAEVRALEPGSGAYAFVTSIKGRILAEVRVRAAEGRLRLELPAGCSEPIAEHLQRYVVADRVELSQRPDWRALTLLGRAAPEVVASLTGGEPPDARWAHWTARWRDRELLLERDERLGAPAITLRSPAEAAAGLARELLETVKRPDLSPVGWLAAEAVRVEAGLARFGPDFGPERFPQEVGADEALDFEKGCYLGQEVVARIHYRGGVNHRLVGLLLEGDAMPAAGSPVRHEGQEVGAAGTAVRSPRQGRAIALAVLHRRVTAGVRVQVDGGTAEAVELPFADGGGERGAG